MADIKLTALPLAGAVAGGDLLYLVQNPGSAPVSVKITASQLQAMIAAGIAAGGALHQATHRPGGLDVLVNNAWTDAANIFGYDQTIQRTSPTLQLEDTSQPVDSRMWKIRAIGTELVFRADDSTGLGTVQVTTSRLGKMAGLRRLTLNGSGIPETSQLEIQGGVHPALVLNDLQNQAIDVRKARILYYQQQIRFDFVNDLESANVAAIYTMDRAGNFSAPGSILGSAAVNTNGTMYAAGTITGNPVNSASTISAAGAINAAALSVTGDVNANVVYGNAIHSYGTLHSVGALTTAASMTASLDIVANRDMRCVGVFYSNTGNYRASGDALGLNMVGGGFQTFSDTWYWTNYANTAHRMLLDSASTLTVYGALNCYNLNTQNNNITTGTLNVGGQTWVGAIHSYGACNSATVNTGAIVCTTINTQNYGITSGPINCHGITCHAINTQGNPLTFGGTSYGGHIYPLANAAGYNLGDSLLRWSGCALALGPSASATYVVTDTSGWLFYLSSERGTKKDIEPLTLDHARAVLSRLMPFRYRDIKDERGGPKVAGFMVEDTMESGNEELVTWYNDKPASVSYDRIGVYLSLVVQDMQRQIDDLQEQLKRRRH